MMFKKNTSKEIFTVEELETINSIGVLWVLIAPLSLTGYLEGTTNNFVPGLLVALVTGLAGYYLYQQSIKKAKAYYNVDISAEAEDYNL